LLVWQPVSSSSEKACVVVDALHQALTVIVSVNQKQTQTKGQESVGTPSKMSTKRVKKADLFDMTELEIMFEGRLLDGQPTAALR
jgi:hypothetical protein